MDIKKTFEKFDNESAFIRTTSTQVTDGSQKAALNRKGNQLFNSGDIEGAKRVFITTGYSDGLSRVGDYYKSQNMTLDALRMYWIAPDRTKSEPLLQELAFLIQSMVNEEQKEEPEQEPE